VEVRTVPQSLSSVLIHLVFSTKNREPWIRGAVEGQLHAYLGGILRDIHCPSLTIGGTADHVHILFVLARTLAISAVVEEVKTGSSKWMKTISPTFQNFHWQAGYGAFSIGQSGVGQLKGYIARQHEHHCVQSFQDEFRGLLTRYEIPFDERYVWD
jgi:putative transposase